MDLSAKTWLSETFYVFIKMKETIFLLITRQKMVLSLCIEQLLECLRLLNLIEI